MKTDALPQTFVVSRITRHSLESRPEHAQKEQLPANEDPQDIEDEQQVYTFSKYLDSMAEDYKEGNSNFKSHYEDLEVVNEDLQRQIDIVNKQITQLKQNPQTPATQMHIQKSTQPENEGRNNHINLTAHRGVKEYQENNNEAVIQSLEKQKSALLTEQAGIKEAMLDMIIDEMKRLENGN